MVADWLSYRSLDALMPQVPLPECICSSRYGQVGGGRSKGWMKRTYDLPGQTLKPETKRLLSMLRQC